MEDFVAWYFLILFIYIIKFVILLLFLHLNFHNKL